MPEPTLTAYPVRLELINAIKRVHSDVLDQSSATPSWPPIPGEIADHQSATSSIAPAARAPPGPDIARAWRRPRKVFVPRAEPPHWDSNQGFRRFHAVGPRGRAPNAAHGKPPVSEITPDHLLLGATDPAAIGHGVASAAGDRHRTPRTAAPPAVTGRFSRSCSAARRARFELTFREASRLGHNYIGTEHLLLAPARTRGRGWAVASIRRDKSRQARLTRRISLTGANAAGAPMPAHRCRLSRRLILPFAAPRVIMRRSPTGRHRRAAG